MLEALGVAESFAEAVPELQKQELVVAGALFVVPECAEARQHEDADERHELLFERSHGHGCELDGSSLVVDGLEDGGRGRRRDAVRRGGEELREGGARVFREGMLEALELRDSVGAAEVGLVQVARGAAVARLVSEALAEVSGDTVDFLAFEGQPVFAFELVQLRVEPEGSLQRLDLLVGQEAESGVGVLGVVILDEVVLGSKQQGMPEELVEQLSEH